MVGQPEVPLQAYRSHQPPAQEQQRPDAVQRHSPNSRQPHQGQYRRRAGRGNNVQRRRGVRENHMVRRLSVPSRGGGGRLVQTEGPAGTHILHRAGPRFPFPHRCVQQAQQGKARPHRHRAQQPEQHYRPQSVGKNLGRPPQCQTDQQYQQNHHAGRQAHVQNHGKQLPGQILQHSFHLLFSSISRCNSLISSSDSRFRAVKAARKAGSEPEKVSSTNCSLCTA